MTPEILIIGGGIFGLTAALELHARHYRVMLVDSGPLPHPLAASTDISKVVRMEYAADALYMELVEESIAGWKAWNTEFGEELYHQVGVMMLTRAPLVAGDFEYESLLLARKRGHDSQRMDSATIAQRFPAWNAPQYVDGFFNPTGGYVESGRIIEELVKKAKQVGVEIVDKETAATLIEEEGRVVGVRTESGRDLLATEQVVVTGGAWTMLLVPDLAHFLSATGHPVFHVKPADPDLFEARHFPVFCADISNTGWYGFPLHPHSQVVKIGNHGVGQKLNAARDPRLVTSEDERALREFLRGTFPALADGEIVYTRRCLYCDTPDGDFLISRHPHRPGLSIATGDSGHGFKFGPVLGRIVADAVEGLANDTTSRFYWRDLSTETYADASRMLDDHRQ